MTDSRPGAAGSAASPEATPRRRAPRRPPREPGGCASPRRREASGGAGRRGRADVRRRRPEGDAAERELERDLDELAARAERADEYLELAQRTKADFENYRKRAERRSARRRTAASRSSPRSCSPRSTTSTARCERAPARGGAARCSQASGSSTPTCSRRSRGSGSSPFSPVGERFDPQYHEAVAPPAGGGGRAGHRGRGLPAGLPARRERAAPGARGRRRVGRSAMAARPDYYKTLGVGKNATERRSRRRTASWPASTTPTATRTTSRRRSASRRSPRPTTCSRTPTSASSTTVAGAVWRLRCPASASPARFGAGGFWRHPLEPVRRRPARGAGGAGRRARTACRRGRGRDLETEVTLTFDQAVHGRPGAARGADLTAVPDLPRHGRQARHAAARLPGLRRARRRGAEPGDLLDLPAVLKCGGSGTVIDDPCPTCQGTGAQRSVRRLRVNIPPGCATAAGSSWPARASPGRAAARPATCT